MLQLITHHTYKLPGNAFDLSRFENHGICKDTSFAADGATPSSGAMLFDKPTSEIRIERSSSFSALGALQIEILLKLDGSPTSRMNLLEGHLAFAFFILPGGVLSGTFIGPLTLGAVPSWHGVESRPPFSPDGSTHTVPAGRWTVLTYSHDGFRGLAISIDGEVVGSRNDLHSAVGPVGNLGTTVGIWPDAAQYTLKGGIDDLKIWRRDPDAMRDEFFSRLVSEPEGNCWAALFHELAERLGRHDEALITALRSIDQLLRRAVHESARDAHFLHRNRDYAARFTKLWTSGNVGSPEMEALLSRWLPEVVKATGIAPTDQGLTRLADAIAGHDAVRRLGRFDCDAQFGAFLKIIRNALAI